MRFDPYVERICQKMQVHLIVWMNILLAIYDIPCSRLADAGRRAFSLDAEECAALFAVHRAEVGPQSRAELAK